MTSEQPTDDKKSNYEVVSLDHKGVLVFGSIVLKVLLMGLVSSFIYCGSFDPNIVSNCKNLGWVEISVFWIMILAGVAGYYVANLKSFDPVFTNVMRTDFLVSAMYLGVVYTLPDVIAPKVMIWMMGIWFFALFLSPFNKEKIFLKKVSQYSGLITLFTLLLVHYLPMIQTIQPSLVLGTIISSFASVFGSGRSS